MGFGAVLFVCLVGYSFAARSMLYAVKEEYAETGLEYVQGHWTPWKNRDDPGWSGDYERVQDYDKYHEHICDGGNHKVIAMQARVKPMKMKDMTGPKVYNDLTGEEVVKTEEVLVDTRNHIYIGYDGVMCNTRVQEEASDLDEEFEPCEDYEVKFFCRDGY